MSPLESLTRLGHHVEVLLLSFLGWVSPLWHQPTSHRSTGRAKVVVALGVSAMITRKMPCSSWHIGIGVWRERGDKKRTLVDCWWFGLMKACPLYWYLYFAFHLASPSFLVLFATAHGCCCCSSLTHGFIHPLMSSDWMGDQSEWALSLFLFQHICILHSSHLG